MSVQDGKKPDLRLSTAQKRAHDEANERGQSGYVDPDTGLFVMTEYHLIKQGFCCGNGCRHCPYDWKSVRAHRLARLKERLNAR